MNNATDAFRSTGSGGSTIAYAQNPLNTDSAERGLSGNDFTNMTALRLLTICRSSCTQTTRLSKCGERIHVERRLSLYERPGLYAIPATRPRSEQR